MCKGCQDERLPGWHPAPQGRGGGLAHARGSGRLQLAQLLALLPPSPGPPAVELQDAEILVDSSAGCTPFWEYWGQSSTSTVTCP